jgi:hypothetical protein
MAIASPGQQECFLDFSSALSIFFLKPLVVFVSLFFVFELCGARD